MKSKRLLGMEILGGGGERNGGMERRSPDGADEGQTAFI